MTASRSLLNGAFWAAMRTWGTRVTSFAVFAVLARLLTPEQIGEVTLIASWLMVLQMVCDLGVSDYLVQARDSTPRQQSAVFWGQFGVALLLGLVILALARPIGAALLPGTDDAAGMVAVMSLVLPLGILAKVPEAMLRRRLDFQAVALRSMLTMFIGGAVGVALAWAGWGGWALVIKTLVEAALDAAVTFAVARWNPFVRFDRESLREPLVFARGIVFARLMEAAYVRADAIIVGQLMGPTALGIYSIGQRLFIVANDLIGGSLQQISVPYLSRVKHDPARLRRMFNQLTELSCVITFPVFFALALLAPVLVPLLFGEKWGESAVILSILALAGAPFGLQHFMYVTPVVMGDGHRLMRNSLLGTLAGLVLLFTGAHWGVIGVAVGFALRPWLVAVFVSLPTAAYILKARRGDLLVLALPGLGSSLLGLLVALPLARPELGLPTAWQLPTLGVAFGVGLLMGAGMFRRRLLALWRDLRSGVATTA
ncbi:lipopolysaccharide biosynthesis protein [Derxia gummosa]|uniref:Lipopolysaccharide biosynthesis protein n=1 Tax=Derxia gummosa DSM 723 TaxID=1121388 RepID=A0A8B6X509_9BURK|nr:lipopolysaccharide biosynthesis protein [Derxia gummosa]